MNNVFGRHFGTLTRTLRVSRIGDLVSVSSFYTVASALNQVLRVLILPVIVRNLDPAELGLYDAARVFIVFAAPLVGIGMESAVAILFNQTPQDAHRRRILMSTGLWLVVFCACTASVVSVMFRDALRQAVFVGEGDELVVTLMIALAATSPLMEYARSLLKWQHRRYAYAALLVGDGAISFALGVYLVVGAHLGAKGWLLATLFSSSCILVIALVLNWSVWITPHFHALGRSMVSLGIPFALVSVSGQLTTIVARFVLVHNGGLAPVGIYGAGERMASFLPLALSGFNVAWGPFYLARQHDPDAGALFGRVASLYLAIATVLGLGIILFSPYAILMLLGEAYSEAWRAVAPLVLANVLAGLALIAKSGLYIAQKGNRLFLVYAISGLLTILVSLIIVPRWQGIGAAFSVLCGQAVGFASVIYATYRLFPIAWETRKLLSLFVSFLFLGLIGQLLYLHLAVSSGVFLIQLGLFFLYLVVLYRVRLLASTGHTR